MKRLLAVLLFMFMLFGLMGCVSTRTFENRIEQLGFVYIGPFGQTGDVEIFLVYDPETMVEYLYIDGFHGSYTLCPYYNENGNIGMYEGE